ncbi:hypothetical protein HanIR_Chr17g0900491 [Helianthus annuus]|nr:hypothetical protein HanIR_Chr17g0900491 [Helianthus annuus]
MALTIIIVKFVFLVSTVYSKVTLENSGFESQPTNLTTNSTSQFVLLNSKTNVIPGWSFNGTVWYVTAGGNISLPGNGHGLQLGPNGVINQTFKTDGSYYYTLTFTLAPSSMNCASNFTAVNVSGSDESKVFIYKESFGSEMWQTYAYSMSREIQRGIMGIQFQSVAGSNDCWPIIDTLLVNGIGSPRLYGDNGFMNSGFEVGPAFLDNSSQGILLDDDTNEEAFKVVQQWTILGMIKYIDSKHYAVPRGRGAVMLVSGNPSGILYNRRFSRHGKITLDFIMGDANDSCVGDFTVYLQVGNYMMWNFTMRSLGVGSRVRHSVTFKAEFSKTESVPISFSSFNATRTSDQQVLCGPVIDSTVIRFSSSKILHYEPVIFCFVLAVVFLI